MLTGRAHSIEKSGAGDGKPPLAPLNIVLPKGDGAIRGVAEKFAANPVTGTGSLSTPIFTSPGRPGFAPELPLPYDSSAGNEAFGFGWSLSLLPSLPRPTRACRAIATRGRPALLSFRALKTWSPRSSTIRTAPGSATAPSVRSIASSTVLLRISGAIQVLEELLAETSAERDGAPHADNVVVPIR